MSEDWKEKCPKCKNEWKTHQSANRSSVGTVEISPKSPVIGQFGVSQA